MRPSGERIMPGGRGQEGPGVCVGCFTGGVLAFLSGRDQPRRPGTRGRAASLTWVRGAQVGRPYLYRPTMQVVQPWLIRRELPWFWACLNLLPAP